MFSRARVIYVLLLIAVIAPYFINLGAPPLWDGSEPFYAETAREMVESNDWLYLHYNYKPRWEKPPLPVWILAASYKLFGVNETAARLPIAIAAAATIVLLYFLGARLACPRAALLGAVFAATSFKFFGFARQYAGDIFLTLGFVAALLLFLRWADSGGARRNSLHAAWLVLGLCTLIKGPIGLLPVFVALLYLWGRRQLRLIRFSIVLEALVILAVVSVPWYAAQIRHYGWTWAGYFFLEQNFARVTTERLGMQPWWYYGPALLAGGLPGSILLLFAAFDWLFQRGWRTLRENAALLPAIWLIFLIVFFSIPHGKRANYLMLMYPAAGLLVGLWLDDALTRSRRTVLALSAAWLVLFCAFAAALGIVVWKWLDTDWGLVLAALGAVAAAVIGGQVWASQWTRAGVAAILALALLLAGAGFALTPLSNFRPVPEFARILESQAAPNDPILTYRADLPSIMFYARRPIEPLATPGELAATLGRYPRSFLVISEPDLRAVATELHGFRWEPLAVRPYLLLTNRHLKFLRQGQLGLPLVLVRVEPIPADSTNP